MISNLVFIPVVPKDGLIGFVSLVYNNSIYLNSIAVKVKSSGDIYLICPSKKFKDTNLQYFYPINAKTYNSILEEVKKQVKDYNEEGEIDG